MYEFLEVFKAFFGRAFSKRELQEIEQAWTDPCRNALILGVYDRRLKRSIPRDRLVQWLNDCPDTFSQEWEEDYGQEFDLSKAPLI